MLSDSVSEGLILQNFLGGMPPDPPRFGMLCMQMCFALFQYLATYISMCVPPLYVFGYTVGRTSKYELATGL